MSEHAGSDQVERWPSPLAWMYAAVYSNPRSNRIVVRQARPGPGDTVLDVGSGAGAAVRSAAEAGAEAVGVDPSPAMVRNAQRRSRGLHDVRFVEGNAADIPLDDESITIALAIATFHHWPDRRNGLEEIRRVLRPGGRLLLGEYRVRSDRSHGLTAAGSEAAAALMREVGYHDIRVDVERVRWAKLSIIEAVA